MDFSLVLLFSLLHVFHVGNAAPLPAAPLPAEVAKMKSKVKWMAEQLVVKLNNFKEVPSWVTTTSPDVGLDGLSSVIAVLEDYNSLISDTLDGVTQIKYEIASLAGYLSQWRQRHCDEQQPKPSVPGPLQDLQSWKEYIHTVSSEALMTVREFIKLLLQNLDNLETC